MEQLKNMKEQLTSLVQGQLAHIDTANTKELGEAVDMIKDLAEAIYYCTVTEAMKGDKEPKQQNHYYTERYIPEYYRDIDRDYGKMYYGGQGGMSTTGGTMSSGMGTGGRNYYQSRYDEMPMIIPHDYREGRSPIARRMYMEGKEMHKDKATQMKELDKYIQELGKDIAEMIEDATPEEKQVLAQKISTLSNKIVM